MYSVFSGLRTQGKPRVIEEIQGYIASNVIGSTPLLCSLVMEAYDSAALLLAANADVHIRNAGGTMVFVGVATIKTLSLSIPEDPCHGPVYFPKYLA